VPTVDVYGTCTLCTLYVQYLNDSWLQLSRYAGNQQREESDANVCAILLYRLLPYRKGPQHDSKDIAQR
jgi:hypothetical protein